MGLEDQIAEQGAGQGTGPIRTLVEIMAIGAGLGVFGDLMLFSVPEFREYLLGDAGLQEKLILFGLPVLEGALLLPAIAYGGYGLLRAVVYFAGHYVRQ
ncbi:hypothetical protein HYV82_01780 [Candidatus Woesearchaeota archaeon]|nr:hypothetical protein [Candidatus Woesearchaeota archaeon]